MYRYHIEFFLLRVYFGNGVKCDKKAVTAASLEGQPCQIQRLIIDDDTASATNISTKPVAQPELLQGERPTFFEQPNPSAAMKPSGFGCDMDIETFSPQEMWGVRDF